MAKKNTNNNQGKLFKKEIPKMPDGYYSGDKPNPNLRKFVEEHIKENPYDPESDDYNVPAFDKPIQTTKATAIYNMHTYWSKKPHDAIREYIRHYTKPGDLVLDPFSGSGGTALAALMEGRKAIAIDRSPAATFITKNYCTPVDVDELQAAFEELKKKVKPEIDWLYETRCDRCGGKATTAYTVYSQVFQCPRCLEKVLLFDCVEAESVTAAGKPKKISVCPHCKKKNIDEEISTRGDKFGSIPVLVSYICEKGCKPKRGQRLHNDPDPEKRRYFEEYDLAKLKEIEERDIPYWYPTHRMMHAPEDQECWGVKWRAGTSNFKTVDELYTKRNLRALATLLNGINGTEKDKDVLLFTFTSILLKSSRMMAHNNDGIGRIQKGTYYIPQNLHDIHVWKFMEEALGDMISGYKQIVFKNNGFFISTSSATNLTIQNDSIDYIFTDPPYADKVQYGELNFVWESWLNFDLLWHDEEIVINEIREKSEEEWTRMMKESMSECYRVLKPGRTISLCYHDTSEGTWSTVQDMMAEVGFIVEKTEEALFIDTKTKTTNQYFADKVNKRDLIINFRKPKPGETAAKIAITGDEDESTFNEKVLVIIRAFLESHQGSTKDHVYDEVVSRMVRTGDMEAHNFDELLKQVAEEVKEPVKKDLFKDKAPELFGGHEVGRWYLKESEMEVMDEAESAREDSSADNMRSFMKKYLKPRPDEEGVHYSDLFEHYVYSIGDKPRRSLAEWLPDYFYKTEDGTWRPPVDEKEEKLKADGRARGTGRKIKRFLSLIAHGAALPEKERPNDATLAQWIRHCKMSGMYEQGKLLYEKGGLNEDALSEEALVNVEEDYQVCSRMLDRAAQGKKEKKSKKKKQEELF